MNSGDWSHEENDAVVAAYFSMLSDELSGRSYNKAAQNRLLQEQIGRSRGSVEFKLDNISAAFQGVGLPIITGYKPRFNFQMSLAEAVSRWLARHGGGRSGDRDRRRGFVYIPHFLPVHIAVSAGRFR